MSMLLKNTRQWIDKYDPVSGYICCKLVLFCPVLFDIVHNFRNSPDDIEPSEISPVKWYKYYRSHRKIGYAITEQSHYYQEKFLPRYLLKRSFDRTQKLVTAKGIKLEDEISDSFTADYIIKVLVPIKKILFKNLDYDAKNIIGGYNNRMFFLEHSKKYYPELCFFLRTLVPFWLEYGELLFPVYQNARRGDIDSIEKILVLDKSIIHEPKIAQKIEILSRTPKHFDYQRIIKALNTDISEKVTLHKIKIMISGLIFMIWNDYGSISGKKLTKPQIRALFDSVSLDLYGIKNDQDLTDLLDDNFRTQTNKAAQFWRSLSLDFGKIIAASQKHYGSIKNAI